MRGQALTFVFVKKSMPIDALVSTVQFSSWFISSAFGDAEFIISNSNIGVSE